MIGFNRNKGEDQDKYKDSMEEIRQQLEKNKNIGLDCQIDLDKYDQLIAEIEAELAGLFTTNDLGEKVNIVQERERLIEKANEFVHMFQNIKDIKEAYQREIEAIQMELQQPEAELSRIKVRVKKKKQELMSLKLQEDVEQIPEILMSAQTLLKTIEAENKEQYHKPEGGEVPLQMINAVRNKIEEDEKVLYGLRKSVHTAKEILNFMEFRFAEIDKQMAKGGRRGISEEWGKLRSDKENCERYVNEQFLIAKRSADRLYEVRTKLTELENKINGTSEEESDDSVINELLASIGSMREHATELQKEAAEFEYARTELENRFVQIEMRLEEMWNNL